MKTDFGCTNDGRNTALFTITGGGLKAVVSDYGATLVRLYVPDRAGNVDDVVLGFDHPEDYKNSTAFLGATVGRNANRVRGARFALNGEEVTLGNNENGNNLHSGPDTFRSRLWQVVSHTENAITLRLDSPHGDQGFPGNAVILVTYALEEQGTLRIAYDAVADRYTVFVRGDYAVTETSDAVVGSFERLYKHISYDLPVLINFVEHGVEGNKPV